MVVAAGDSAPPPDDQNIQSNMKQRDERRGGRAEWKSLDDFRPSEMSFYLYEPKRTHLTLLRANFHSTETGNEGIKDSSAFDISFGPHDFHRNSFKFQLIALVSSFCNTFFPPAQNTMFRDEMMGNYEPSR